MKKILFIFCIIFGSSITSYSQKLKNFDDSLKNDKKSIEFEKLFVQANLEKNRGNIEQATTLYFDCLKLKQSDAVYYELAKLSLQKKNNKSEAGENIKKALKLSPRNEEYKRFSDSLK